MTTTIQNELIFNQDQIKQTFIRLEDRSLIYLRVFLASYPFGKRKKQHCRLNFEVQYDKDAEF